MGVSNQIDVSGEDLLKYLPQRSPMIMVDRLTKADEKGYEGMFTVRSDNIFLENGVFSEAGLIENIAQTSAVGYGYFCAAKNSPIPIGYIGAVQNLVINFLPKLGSELKTIVTIGHSVMNVSIGSGAVYLDNEISAQCDLKVFLQK